MSRLVIAQGVTQSLRVNHDREDVTGWSFRGQIRSPSDGRLLTEWTNAQVTALPYVLFLPIDPAESVLWTWSVGVLGVEATSPTGQVIRMLQAQVELSREVVRP